MADETILETTKLKASYGREITLQDMVHESGLRMMRVRIREGSRFTILDIDSSTAQAWGTALKDWALQAKTNA